MTNENAASVREDFMRKADLHLHTHASSDASFDPEAGLQYPKARGLTAVTFSERHTDAE